MDAIQDLRQELTLAAQRLYTQGLQTNSGGNLSARIPDSDLMMIKPSGCAFANCTNDTWIITDFKGQVVEGTGIPSKEFSLHALIYLSLPKINAIVHCHAPWSVGWSNSREFLPTLTYTAKHKFGCRIPILDINGYYVPKNELRKIEKLFQRNPNLPAFILANHGAVAVGKNVKSAHQMIELVEETAQIACIQEMVNHIRLD